MIRMQVCYVNWNSHDDEPTVTAPIGGGPIGK
jgi:hypothetical protein